MNKTIIALAIAAALPVAAQADMTLSGSVTTKYKNTGVIDTDTAFSASSSEVLANGMTATASFDVLGGENQGSATLAGDFGTLTAGKIDADGAFQAGDVGGAVGNTEDDDEGDTTVSGVHFTTTQAGLAIAAQVNASTGPDATTSEGRSTQMGVTYGFNGITLGYSYASADANTGTDGGIGGPIGGVTQNMTAFGVSYTMGDISLTAGKDSVDTDTDYNLTYSTSMDALTVKAQYNNDSEIQIDLTYALSDSLTLSSEIDTGKTTTMVAAYTSGDMTAKVSKTDDGTTDASVALDFGNADLTLARNGGDADTSVTYKVAF
jgi:predicted porin